MEHYDMEHYDALEVLVLTSFHSECFFLVVALGERMNQQL